MIQTTLTNIKEHRIISALFKQILIKFQQEGLSFSEKDKRKVQYHQSVVVWLKTLLTLHWPLLIKSASKEDLSNLGAIQAYIQKKTKYMDKVLLLRGKIEMLSKTIEIRK